MKYYYAFGIVIGCNLELPLPEYPGEEKDCLEIRLLEKSVEVPDGFVLRNSFLIEGNGDDDMGSYYERGDEKWVRYRAVCDFWIRPLEQKMDCYYRVPENLELAEIYLLSDCISAYLRHVKQYVFHAAAVRLGNKSYVFSAEKGGGKSTLLASLVNSGGDVISDDLVPLFLAEQGVMLRSSFPSVKLNSGQFPLATDWISDARPVLKGSLKKSCTLKSERYAEGDFPLNAFFVIHPVTADEPIQVRKLNAAEGFVALLQCIFSGTTASNSEIIAYQKVIRRILKENLAFQLDIPRDLEQLPNVIDVLKHFDNGKEESKNG